MKSEKRPERSLSPKCECCNTGHLVIAYRSDSFEHEDDTGTITIKADRVPFEVCDSCHSVFVTKETLRARHEAICRHFGLITPAEIIEIRARHGLSRAEFARITQFGEASLFRWERGRLLPNQSSSNFLKLLLKNRANVDILLAQATESRGISPAEPIVIGDD